MRRDRHQIADQMDRDQARTIAESIRFGTAEIESVFPPEGHDPDAGMDEAHKAWDDAWVAEGMEIRETLEKADNIRAEAVGMMRNCHVRSDRYHRIAEMAFNIEMARRKGGSAVR